MPNSAALHGHDHKNHRSLTYSVLESILYCTVFNGSALIRTSVGVVSVSQVLALFCYCCL